MEGNRRAELRNIIAEKALVRAGDGVRIVGPQGRPSAWLFDIRAVLFDARFLGLVADLFWEEFSAAWPFQVGGLETASLPLIAAISLKGRERGTPVNGFYIRKSRKPHGLQKIVEGELTGDPVVLVDDLINSGSAFLKQVEVIEREGARVAGLFTLVRFRDEAAYPFAQAGQIAVHSLFSLGDFGLAYEPPRHQPVPNPFEVLWYTRHGTPSYFHRVPKSAPAIDASNVYYGADDGVMRALRQDTGEPVWEFRILGFGAQGKTIFSSPALLDGMLYFGAYDGNFYALDAATGKQRWLYLDAEWIGSSPCVAEDLGLVYVGLEYGLFRKRGGIVALDARTGQKRWEYIAMPELTHGSPAYSKRFNAVAIGSNDGRLYLFDARDGSLRWTVETGGAIKAAPAFDEASGLLVFGSFDQRIHVVDVKTGRAVFSHATGGPLYSTPLVADGRAYVAGLDKRLYCLRLDPPTLDWSAPTEGRIFSSPALVEGSLCLGANDGRLYLLDPDTGRNTAFFQATERITNKVVYNPATRRLFLPTYAGELYCLRRIDEPAAL